LVAGKKVFFCEACGYETFKWMGKCPECGEWNTIEEKAAHIFEEGMLPSPPKAVPLGEIKEETSSRIPTGVTEFDRVLGGGAVKGSVLLVGGDPGIGKSTLMLQTSSYLARESTVLYISGEESLGQIKIRSRRLDLSTDFLVVAENSYSNMVGLVEEHQPGVLIIDSIQSLYYHQVEGLPGSVSQVKEVAFRLINLAKQNNMVVFLVGHVTKEGSLAGPRLLEHMVDGVFYLEGDRFHTFRLLRGAKNRFGSTNELGVFFMGEKGMDPVTNPSYLFLSGSKHPSSGATIAVSMEGSRPILVEIQSLVNSSSNVSPRRTSSGLDLNRLALNMAVLEKHGGLSFYGLDAFVNVVGGVKLVETAMDLPLALSLVSSVRQKPVDKLTAVFGEISLTGEIRPVSRAFSRVKEAKKLGFERCLLPEKNKEELLKQQELSMELQGVSSLKEAMEIV